MMKRANTTKVAPEGGASELGSALLAKAAAGLSGEALSAVHEAWEQGQPPLGETYAKPANHSVQRCLLFGGDSLVGHKSTNLTNKAVISALLLTVNIPTLMSDATGLDATLLVSTEFRISYMAAALSVVMSFLVMLSAAIYVSHIAIVGPDPPHLIVFLAKMDWVDTALNEAAFIGQCVLALVSMQAWVALYYEGQLLFWLHASMLVLLTVVLVGVLASSTLVWGKMIQQRWAQLLEYERLYRATAYAKGASSQADNTGAE